LLPGLDLEAELLRTILAELGEFIIHFLRISTLANDLALQIGNHLNQNAD